MAYKDRAKLMRDIEQARDGRTLVAICNFDRKSEPELPGLNVQFDAGLKECLYRILKESPAKKGIDIFLYTRGGDTNSVWPIASLLREFDPDFEVLVPFRAHSAGTMLALAAKRITMTRIGELSPIDPTTGNQFNPKESEPHGARLGISVEDLRAYQDFIRHAFSIDMNRRKREITKEEKALIQPFLQRLTESIHPLALGNVHRVHQLVSRLAKKLMSFHRSNKRDPDQVVKALTVETYSHLHMIGRAEAAQILGRQFVHSASAGLEAKLDRLLKRYEDDFRLRSPLFGARLMGQNEPEKDVRFVGGVVESRHWAYIFETRGKLSQHSRLPEGVTVQLPPGQAMPLVPGLSREMNIEVHEQRWYRNTKPEGVTV